MMDENCLNNYKSEKTKCTICGSLETQIYKIVQSPFIDKKFILHNCKTCKSFFFINEYEIDLDKLYNDENKDWLDYKFTRSIYWSRQRNRINRLIKNKKQLNVLDVGCRTGDFLLHWNKKNNLYGVELNKHNANISKERGIIIYNDFVENIDFNIKYDVITCYALLEHLANPEPILNKLTEILNVNGILVVMIPSIESKLRENLDSNNIHWHMYSPPEHLSFYSRRYLDDYMAKQNLILLNRYFTSGGLNGIYSKKSETYRLLKNADYKSLQNYFSSNRLYENTKKSSANNIANKFNYLKKILFAIADEYSIFNKYPYFDHMYSYYRKTK